MGFIINPFRFASCVPSTELSQLNQNGGGVIATGYQVLYGLEINASYANIGKSINRLTFYLDKYGSPTGIISARIYSGTVGNSTKTLVSTSTTTQTIEGLNTTPLQWYDFDFEENRVLTAGDCLVLEMTTNTSTSLSNRIDIGYQGTQGTPLANVQNVTATVSSPTSFVFNFPTGYQMSMTAEQVC